MFTSADAVTKLDHEIESYNSATGELIAWVEVPFVSSTADTVIYMYYGNAGAADQWNMNGTWDSNFEAVWHLAEDPSVSTDCAGGAGTKEICDSTSNNNDGDSFGGMTSGDQVAGQIVGSLDFDGSNDYISVPNNTTPNFTASAWIYHRNISPACGGPPWSGDAVLGNSSWSSGSGFNRGYIMRFWCIDTDFVYIMGDPSVWSTSRWTTVALTTWTHVAISYDGTTFRAYQNGDLDGTPVGPRPYTPSTTSNLHIGHDFTNSGVIYFNGIIDEVRISDIARSDDWIKASYNNQDNPSSFLSFGAPMMFTPVPTMTGWGVIIFIVLAGFGAIYYLRRHRTV